jgi:K+-sensing histidine kinase KdpD
LASSRAGFFGSARLDAGVCDDRMESLDLDELVAGIAEDVGVEAEAQGVGVRLAPGVAESELASIFEPFYRGAGAARRGEGYGLGLAIAKSVMQRHRGTVAARNRSGGGLVVSLCLPRG